MVIAVVVITPNILLRAGIRTCLEEPNYQICREVGSIAEALEPGLDKVDLVIAAEDPTPEFLKAVGAIREHFPTARLALYAKAILLDVDDIAALLETKFDGILTSEMSMDVVQHFVNLIMMGERVAPFAVVVAALRHRQESIALDYFKHGGGKKLSAREWQVLKLLTNGLSNKMIARRIGLSQATVKVHLGALIHKIGVANRTQAAIWALEHEVSTGATHL